MIKIDEADTTTRVRITIEVWVKDIVVSNSLKDIVEESLMNADCDGFFSISTEFVR